MLSLKSSTTLIALLAFFSLPLPGQVTVIGVTSTQAVLRYQVSTQQACRVQVSQDASLSPLAADVDPVLFPGSDLDSRPEGISSTAESMRYFVVGKHRADKASDGKFYSRALQTFSEYFYRVTCGDTLLSGRFVTGLPPLGDNFPAAPPFDASGFGNYAWPTIDWNDAGKTYIDPMTGILLKRATSPGWYGQSQTGKLFGFAVDVNGAWTNAPNILTGGVAKLASYSGIGGDPIFVAITSSQLSGFGGRLIGGWNPISTLDNVMLRVFGTGTATISACLSDDSGGHCASPPVDVVKLGSSGGDPAGTYPLRCVSETDQGCFPNYGFWGGWNFTPVNGQIGARSGLVNVSGSTVTAGANTQFDLNWKAGGRIFIAGSGCTNSLCTIKSVESSGSLTIVESAGTLTAAQFQTANSGIILWVKKTQNPTSASISVNFDYSYSDNFTMPLKGDTAQCSSNPTTVYYAADGVTSIPPVAGELCLATHDYGPEQVLYLLIPSTGETRMLSPIYFFNSSDPQLDQASGVTGVAAAFDATDPNTIYVKGSTPGGVAIFRGQYNAAAFRYKAYPHSLYPSATSGYVPGEITSGPSYHGMAWTDTGISWINLTKASLGQDLGTQIASTDPHWDSTLFGGPVVTQVANGRAFTGNGSIDYGETINLVHSFDLSTGRLVQTADSYSTFPARWCAAHTNVVLEGWYGLSCNPLGGTYTFKGNSSILAIGPWQLTPTAVLKAGVFSTDTSLTASSPADACPTIPAFLLPYVPTNPACVTFQSQMACSHTPHLGENLRWPCESNPAWSELQPIAPGDGILVPNGGPTGVTETLLVVSVSSLGNANYQFTAVRGSTKSGSRVAPAGWTGYMVPPSTNCDPAQCTAGQGLWFDTTAGSVTWRLDPGAFSGHSDLGGGPTAGANTYCDTSRCRFNVPMDKQIGAPYPINIQKSSFAGISGNIAVQGYPSLHQFTAPPTEQVWMLNYRHLNPSAGQGADKIADIGPVAYTLVSGTKGVYRFTQISGGLNYKTIPPIAYAGYHLLQDRSSAAKGDIISDSTPWQFCVALAANECRLGSSAGEAYLSVPSGRLRVTQNCVSNWYDDNYPCIFTSPPQAAWAVQQGVSRSDPQGTNWRRITMGLSGPGRQFQFGTFIPDPTGTWAFMQAFWPDGARNDLLMAKLPPWPSPKAPTINRSNFMPESIQIKAAAGLSGARIRFGYAENGAVDSYYCTPRQDACVTGGSPFAFQSENPGWVSCNSGCAISIPAISGRVLYYVVDRQDGSGNLIPGEPKVMVVR